MGFATEKEGQPSLPYELLPVLQDLFSGLDVYGRCPDFTKSLRSLWELAQEGLLTPLMGSVEAMEALMESAPVGVKRSHGEVRHGTGAHPTRTKRH